ncbi:MAG: 50S ribosomal protein L35 [Candidatus Levybacteria bacterium]|nr:50S ribosomal protein L35 [Candidatus Levybacteria bacterium]
MKKNKKKIKKSVSRRFKVTKTGKVMFSHQNVGHLKKNKTKSHLRRGKEPGVLNPVFGKKIKKQLNAA